MEQHVTASIIDPKFPQIPKILDSGYMLGTLQNAWFCNAGEIAQKIKIESCRIGEKRYKPGKSFTLSYNISLRHVETDIRHEQIVTAQLCPGGQVTDELKTYLENPAYSSIDIPSVSHISEDDMILWAFPQDRKLIHLPKLLDINYLCIYFTTHKSAFNISSPKRISSVQPEIIHYLPEQSCMFRYTLDITDESGVGKLHQIVLYGKNYRDDEGVDTYSIMTQLSKQTGSCAKPYAYDEETKTLWQPELPGKPFEWISSLPTNYGLITKVAICIAEFHRCHLETTKHYGFPEIDKQLQDTCDIALSANPALGTQVQAAVHIIRQNHTQLDWSNTVTTPIHLDLKMGNLLIYDHKVSLIDMDCVQLGDPLADTGSFIANLYLNGLRAGAKVRKIDEVVAVFCDEYYCSVNFAINCKQLNWYISAALIHEVVRRSLRQQDEERLQLMDKVIELSNRYSTFCHQDINGKSHAKL
jgi:Phosphotransferase enzyme family